MAFTYCTNCGEKIDDNVDKCPHCNHPKGAERAYGYSAESFGQKKAEENGTQRGQNEQGTPQGGNPWGGNNGQGNPQGGAPWGGNNGQGNPQGGAPWGGNNGQGNPQGGNPWQGGQNPYGQNPYGQDPYGRPPYGQGWQGGNGNPWQGGQGPYGGPQYGGYQPWQPRERRKISVGLLVFSIINILLGTCCAGSIFGIIGLIFAATARDAATEAEELRRKKISLAVNIIAVVLTVVFMISFAVGFIQSGGFAALFG